MPVLDIGDIIKVLPASVFLNLFHQSAAHLEQNTPLCVSFDAVQVKLTDGDSVHPLLQLFILLDMSKLSSKVMFNKPGFLYDPNTFLIR